MGSYPYTYDKHTWELPYTYRPIFQNGIGGESSASVVQTTAGLEFDLTYFSGSMGLSWEQPLLAGVVYKLIVRGKSQLRVANSLQSAANFSVSGETAVGEVLTRLPKASMGVEGIGHYGEVYWEMRGDREYTWLLFADSDLVVNFEVVFTSIWKTGQHGSAFVLSSVSLLPVEWSGDYEDLIIIGHYR
jgi:hypothetical protein